MIIDPIRKIRINNNEIDNNFMIFFKTNNIFSQYEFDIKVMNYIFRAYFKKRIVNQ